MAPEDAGPLRNKCPDRFRIFRLCECSACGGRGKINERDREGEMIEVHRCPECRGEGRVRQELTSVPDEESVGVALVQLARDGEFDGGCQFGLLDSDGEKGKRWLILPWPDTARTVSAAARTLAKSKAGKR